METEKNEMRASEILKPKYEGVGVDENGDLIYTKPHQSFLYKILKYNPIDPLNDLYRWVVDQFHFAETEGELQWWGAFCYVRFVSRLLWNFKAENLSGMLFPEIEPVILVGSHQSHLDPFFYGAACHRRIQYMSKEENFKTPLQKTLFKNLGAFTLGERGNEQDIKKSIEMARSILQKGKCIGIFPEGTRSKDGTIGEFRTGAVRLAIEEHVAIVPMAVLGSRDALPKGKLLGKFAQVTVRVGAPIRYDNYDINKTSPQEVRKLTNELRDVVVSLKEGTYGGMAEKKKEELSIGSIKDIEQKPRSNSPLKILKRLGMNALWTIDDLWYAFLRCLQELDTMEHFQAANYHFSGNMVNHMCNLMSPYRVLDYEKNIPNVQETGAIICSNHNSEWDVIMLATTFQQRGQVVYQQAKDSLFKIPLVNAWVRSSHAFPLRRGEHDVESYEFTKSLLARNKWVIIYPEGTTNSGGGELLKGHTGPLRIAIEAQVPIYVVGITGTENVYPKHAKMLSFGHGVILKAGKPFLEHKKYWGKTMPDYAELQRLTDSMMARIKELMMYDNPDI